MVKAYSLESVREAIRSIGFACIIDNECAFLSETIENAPGLLLGVSTLNVCTRLSTAFNVE